MQPGNAASLTLRGAPPRPALELVWRWLDAVPDPEIPAISIVDLGLVREVRWGEGDELVLTITPTYSGCPATSAIAHDIVAALRARGVDAVRLETRLAPPWTTDWISERGRDRLQAYGIAPPGRRSSAPEIRFLPRVPPRASCPRCGSTRTTRVSEFGSTPCKAQYTCSECLEPFDAFKRL